MRRSLTYNAKHPSDFLQSTMLIFSLLLIGYGFLFDPPWQIAIGLYQIVTTQAVLITDSMLIGGVGAAFVNAGLVTLISVFLLRLAKVPFSGISVACLFLMAGFSLFGKDVSNIFPIIIGGYLYSLYKQEPFSRYIYISLFGTALAPVVTEIASIGQNGTPLFRYLIGCLIGLLIGFVLPPLAAYTLRVHQGYNLYNVGFTAGLIGMVLASLFKSFGHEFDSRMVWSTGYNLPFSIFLFLLFGIMVFTGFWLNGKCFSGFSRIHRHTGRSVADFILLDGYPLVLINMGVVGGFATAYVLLVGGDLNGPTIGGILTICGFGAFGKHMRNIVPVMAGVVISSYFMVWKLDSPSVLLAALFSTGLAPISGQYGWKWGILAGILHASVVLNTNILHGGLNLYNNGFAAGLVCMVLLPLIEAFRKEDGD